MAEISIGMRDLQLTEPLATAQPVQAARQPGRFYRPELDILRFFAFFIVFVHHSLPSSADVFASRGLGNAVGSVVRVLGQTGALGVDLFFALSAYLITELLLREKRETGRLDVRAFWIRRILRIWPLYFLSIPLIWLLWYVGAHEFMKWQYIAGLLLLSGNWSFCLFGVPSIVLSPLWSISVEEQFYLVWPAVVCRASRRTIAILAGAILVFAGASRVYLLLRHIPGPAMWCSTFTRLDPLACGILVAVALNGRIPRLRTAVRLAFLLIGMLLWIAACGTRGGLTLSEALLGPPAIALGAVLFLFSFLGAEGSVFRSRRLRHLGVVSYGLYVFHTPCMYLVWLVFGRYLVGHSFPVYWGGKWVLSLGITILVALTSYRFYESPFLRLKARFARVQSRPV